VVVESKYGSSWGGWCSSELVVGVWGRYGKILEGVGESSIVTPNLKWMMVPMLGSGMIFGVKRWRMLKSFYNALGCRDGLCFPWKSVWRTKAPLRVAFLCGRGP
jgi:hypothetical protein